jgi:hypothetical protein
MVERVHFTAPQFTSDLRLVMSNVSATQHDHFAVAYRLPYGEVRVVSWLTYSEAVRRGKALRSRGYKVAVGPMDV